MNAHRMAVLFEKWIASQDYEALFTRGACFHFALRLQALTKGEIHGIPTNDMAQKEVGHVWCVVDLCGRRWGVDVRGIYPETVLADWAVKWPKDGRKVEPIPVDVSKVNAQIAAKGLSSDLNDKLFGLADWIIATHERFSDLGKQKLTDQLKAELVKDL